MFPISVRLLKTIPEARIRPYRQLADVHGIDVALLYRWNSQVTLAMFDDLSVLEVSMRSAMARELHCTFGSNWFRNPALFDDDTVGLISRAWEQGRLSSLNAPPDVVHGKLAASLMFGFWVKILGKGSHRGLKDPHTRTPLTTRRVYDELLWKPALYKAFPGVSRLERSKVERAARDLQFVRNRVAHHEHVIWGIPAYGQKQANGTLRRMSVTNAHMTLLSVAGYIDPDLASWITANTSLTASLANCPLPNTSALMI